MKFCLKLVILTVFSLWANANNSDAAISLAATLKGYQTLSGQFTQTLVDEQGQLLQTSSGTFIVKKPGYFYWDTQQPFPQLLVSDLESIWLYDPDLEQVTVRSYQNSVSHSPALLLSGDAEQITQNYRVSRVDTPPATPAASPVSARFLLKPRANNSGFTELQLAFAQQTLVQMVMKDSLQQVTTFDFSDIVVNRAFADSTFQFTPPAGVDVLVDE